MKKIAMLNCLKANEVCTGAACFKAFNLKQKHFEIYKDEEIELAAYMRCNGCGKEPSKDDGMIEKIERLRKEGVEVVHVGVCTQNGAGEECKTITEISSMLEEKGIKVIRGTH